MNPLYQKIDTKWEKYELLQYIYRVINKIGPYYYYFY